MRRKVIKVGDSRAVTLPPKEADELGLKEGDEVSVEFDRASREFKLRPAIRIDAELLEWTDRFIKKYRSALDALARK